MSSRMDLSLFPSELLEAITAHLTEATDISAVSKTCRRWFHVAITALYRLEAKSVDVYAITWALKNNRPETIERALGTGADVIQPHHLALAAGAGSSKWVKRMLDGEGQRLRREWMVKHDENVGWNRWSFLMPLVAAAASGNVGIMQVFLDMKYASNIMAKDCEGWTPLGAACLKGHLEAVQLLLKYGANPAEMLFHGYSALTMAMVGCHVEIARALLNCSTPLRLSAEQISTALPVAAGLGLDKEISLMDFEEQRLFTTLDAVRIEADQAGTRPVVTPTSTPADSLACVELLLHHGADANARVYGHGGTALFASILADNTDVVRLLLHHGADTSVVGESVRQKRTPLAAATWKGNKDIIRALLAAGAKINATPRDEYAIYPLVEINATRPLHLVARSGDLEMARLFFQAGADVQLLDDKQRSPLYLASRHGHYDMFKLILEHGGDINRKGPGDSSPLHVVSCPDIANHLLQGGLPVDVIEHYPLDERKPGRENHELTPLIRACEAGRGAVVQVLLEAGADPMRKTWDGYTTLNAAACSGLHDEVELLAKYEVDINEPDVRGNTPLHGAVIKRHLEVVRILVRLGADIQTPNAEGATPLMLALGYQECFDVLIDAGANINPKSGQCQITMLQSWSDLDAVVTQEQLTKLIGLGADLEATSASGHSALHYAIKQKRKEPFRLLVAAGANIHSRSHDGWTPLMTACAVEFTEGVEFLLVHGADVSSKNHKGWTPLMLACSVNFTECLGLLFDHRVDVDMQDHDGWTPLMIATRAGCDAGIHFLLAHGADVNGKGRDGLTPLMIASRGGSRGGCSDRVNSLLSRGADINATMSVDGINKTALHFVPPKQHNIAVLIINSGIDINLDQTNLPKNTTKMLNRRLTKSGQPTKGN